MEVKLFQNLQITAGQRSECFEFYVYVLRKFDEKCRELFTIQYGNDVIENMMGSVTVDDIPSVIISDMTSVLKHAASVACDRAEDSDSDENISDSGGESYSVWYEYE